MKLKMVVERSRENAEQSPDGKRYFLVAVNTDTPDPAVIDVLARGEITSDECTKLSRYGIEVWDIESVNS